ncbi:MAG: hypothetical protein HOD26_21830, partial [Gammaproteobacteria bacterium]|nr:hypothetical protein [Gammaproteobacteria bacterium]
MPRVKPYMSLSHPFTSLVLFCLLAGCAIKEGPDSAQTTDNLFDQEPSAAHKEPSAAHHKEPSAAHKEPSAAHKEPSTQDSNVVQTNLWQRMRDGFRLSHETDRKRVMDELKWYVNHPEYVERVTKRAAPHLHYIIEELEKRGLPL